MTERPEQVTAREYLERKGTRLPLPEIRERVAAAFAALETVLAGVGEAEARRRTIPGEWSVLEVVDHLVETHRPSIAELRDLLAGRRPAGPAIPAALTSADPAGRGWDALRRELAALHAETLGVLDGAADDFVTPARAPVVMVINARDAAGRPEVLHWIEELDWKAYAAVFRLHVLDHLTQVKKTLAAARGAA